MAKSAILAIRIISDADNAKQGLDSTASATSKMAGGIKKASVPAAAALAGIGAAAWAASKDAVDLADSTNAVEKVFGKASATVIDFGESAAGSAGLAQAEFQGLAVSTGALLQNMGQSQDEAAASTVALTQRAADMASVYGGDVSTALQAINSGLKGEADPLEAFGVGLSAAAVKGKALEMGLWDGKGALDANAKAAASTALIMEQTANTQGDFADTATEGANAQKTLSASFKNASAALGSILQPNIDKAAVALTAMTNFVNQNKTAVGILTGVVALFAAGIIAANIAMTVYSATTKAISAATKAYTAIQWLMNAAMAANPIGLVVIAVLALIAGLVLAYKKCDTFRAIVDSLWKLLKGAFMGAIHAVTGAFDAFIDAIKTAWNWISNLIGKVGDLLGKLNPLKALGGIIGKISGNAAAAASLAYGPVPGALGPSQQATITTGAGTGNDVFVTEEQIARAISRVLMRSDARNGRLTVMGAR